MASQWRSISVWVSYLLKFFLIVLAFSSLVGCGPVKVGDDHFIRYVDGGTMLVWRDGSCGIDFVNDSTGKQELFVQPRHFGLTETRIVILDRKGRWWVVDRSVPNRTETGPLSESEIMKKIYLGGEDWPKIRSAFKGGD